MPSGRRMKSLKVLSFAPRRVKKIVPSRIRRTSPTTASVALSSSATRLGGRVSLEAVQRRHGRGPPAPSSTPRPGDPWCFRARDRGRRPPCRNTCRERSSPGRPGSDWASAASRANAAHGGDKPEGNAHANLLETPCGGEGAKFNRRSRYGAWRLRTEGPVQRIVVPAPVRARLAGDPLKGSLAGCLTRTCAARRSPTGSCR